VAISLLWNKIQAISEDLVVVEMSDFGVLQKKGLLHGSEREEVSAIWKVNREIVL
jgi:hypothetical protein